MAKLGKKQKDLLLKVGLSGFKTLEEAEDKLRKLLKKEDVDEVDDEDLETLVELYEVFYDEDVDQSADEEEEEADEEADERERLEVKLSGLTRKKLKKYIKRIELEVKISKKDDEEDIVAKILEAVFPEQSEEEIDADALAEEVDKKSKDENKGAKDKAKGEVKKSTKTRNGLERFDIKNNESHEKYIKPIKKLFSKEDFVISLLKQGFTIRKLGENVKVPVINYDELKIQKDGTLIGNAYFNRFKSDDDLLEHLDDDLLGDENDIGMFRGESHPCIKKITTAQLIDILESGVLEETLNRCGKTDKRMGDNREKLEKSLVNKKNQLKEKKVEEVEEKPKKKDKKKKKK